MKHLASRMRTLLEDLNKGDEDSSESDSDSDSDKDYVVSGGGEHDRYFSSMRYVGVNS